MGSCNTCVHSGCCEYHCGGHYYSPQYVECYECGRMTPKRLAANRANGRLGGLALAAKRRAEKGGVK